MTFDLGMIKDLRRWRTARPVLLEAWRDVRAQPLQTGLIALALAVASMSLVTGVGAVIDSGGNPFATIDATLGVLFKAVLGYGAALLCAGFFGVFAAVLAWVLPRRTRRIVVSTSNRASRRWGQRILLVMVWLLTAFTVLFSGLLTIAVFAVLVLAAVVVTRMVRLRRRIQRWLLATLAGTAGEFSPEAAELAGWKIRRIVWGGADRPTKLIEAEVAYPESLRSSEPARRQAIERAISWAFRFESDTVYAVAWPAGTRVLRLVAEPPLPQGVMDGPWPANLPGVPVGLCASAHADVTVTIHHDDAADELVPLRLWDPSSERDLLVCGIKGSGKTVLLRGIVVRWIAPRPGKRVWILDGKFGADYAAFEDREGIVVVARTEQQWRAALEHLIAEMRRRYDANYEYQAGRSAMPDYEEELVVVDEIQNIRHVLGDEGDEFIDALARMARAAKMRLVFATQRPDAKDAIPGAIRDQLEDRIALGWMSRQGAEMMLGPNWRAITGNGDNPDVPVARPRGFGVALLAGKLSPIQVPNIPTPIDDPGIEYLYPPLTKPRQQTAGGAVAVLDIPPAPAELVEPVAPRKTTVAPVQRQPTEPVAEPGEQPEPRPSRPPKSSRGHRKDLE